MENDFDYELWCREVSNIDAVESVVIDSREGSWGEGTVNDFVLLLNVKANYQKKKYRKKKRNENSHKIFMLLPLLHIKTEI